MIRLRSADGAVLEAEDHAFVELCDADGNVVFVFFKDGPFYRVISKKDVEASRYTKVYGVEFAEHKDLKL